MIYLYLIDNSKDYYLNGKLIDNVISVNLDEGIIRYRLGDKVITDKGNVSVKDKKIIKVKSNKGE